MGRENDFDSLRKDLLTLVADQLTPVAQKYGYSDAPLETNIKWRPLVLVLGNYSSGKSAMINEFLGADIQATGQAPTDDSFTVITYDESASNDIFPGVTEERDGKVLLNDPEYPFSALKKHGQRFSSHFRLKKVHSPFLRTLAIIDTPGMLDSITQRDRGYNYQEVIGDLAQIADLVLVLFDPHKAGTIREAHISLRDTLPTRTFEDRVIFILNRIDECASLIDLLRVYGTLCWNLSQITGRKDIPTIHLTYSPRAAANSKDAPEQDTSYLKHLENQREDLKKAILKAPRHRLDNLATFVETHSGRLAHFLESLISYRRVLRMYRLKNTLVALIVSVLCGTAAVLAMMTSETFSGTSARIFYGIGGITTITVFLLWIATLTRYFASRYHRALLRDIDRLTLIETQTRKDSWEAVRDLAHSYLKKTAGRFSLKDIKRDYAAVQHVHDAGSKDIRKALSEISSNRNSDSPGTGGSDFGELTGMRVNG